MRKFLFSTVLALAVVTASAQQPNMGLSSISVNGTPTSGPGPITAAVFTDSNINVNVQGLPNKPVLCLFGAYSANATVTPYNFKIDILNQGFSYANQILFNGFTNPSPQTWTDPSTGLLTFTGLFPACTFNSSGVLTCLSQTTFTSTVQAICSDPSNAPFNVRSTAACTMTFTNGYTNFALTSLANDASVNYNFLGGFSFNFYGTSYTSCFVSENGFISFGGSDTGFPTPSTSIIRSGVRRIMSFFTDLDTVSTPGSYNPRIYAQMYVENGVRRVRIVHSHIGEFGGATGPHGGEITISENGDIWVFVNPYQVAPSISTAVGITPGNNLDPGGSTGQTAFGRNLSNDFLLAPTPLGTNKIGFEEFNYSSFPVTNAMDLIGLGFDVSNPLHSGIKFVRNPAVTGTSAEYIVTQ